MLWPAKPDKESSYWGALRWCLTSDEQLLHTEAHLLSGVKSIEEGVFVDIGPVIDPAGDRILTYIANKEARNQATPLLLVHGFAGGAGLWSQNIDALAKDRTVYVIDVVGFGRSSRPTFSHNPMEAEDQFISTIEAWRKVMGLEKIYLLGHSFGGYLSTLYAMKYPDRVEHLVLVDPWGFPARPPSYKLPVWALPIEFGAACVLPLFALRAAGPLGYLYLRLVPPFNTHNFRSVSNAKRTTADYFYHVNCKKPSGEIAFHKLMEGIAWARFPMLPRMHGLCKEVPITFVYGEKSWVWRSSGFKIQETRKDSYVDVEVVAAAGHVVSSDQPQVFNAVVSRVLRSIDSGETPANILTQKHAKVQSFTGTTVMPPLSSEDEKSPDTEQKESNSPLYFLDAGATNTEEHPNTEEHQPSTGEHQSSTGEHQSSTGEHQSSTGEHQSSTGEHQSSTGEHQSSTEEHQSSTGEHQSSTGEGCSNTARYPMAELGHSNAEQGYSSTDDKWLSVEGGVTSAEDVWMSADEGHSGTDQECPSIDLDRLTAHRQEGTSTIHSLSNTHELLCNTDQESTRGRPATNSNKECHSRIQDRNELQTIEKDSFGTHCLVNDSGLELLSINDDIQSDLFDTPSTVLDANFTSPRSKLFPAESMLDDMICISAQKVGPKRKKGKIPRNKTKSDIATNCNGLVK